MARSYLSPEVYGSVGNYGHFTDREPGTAGLGKASVLALAKHQPAHVYFTGRDNKAAESVIAEVKQSSPGVGVTFVKLDMKSLASVKSACAQFTHDRLDILL